MLTEINLINQTSKINVKKQKTNYKNTVQLTSPIVADIKIASSANFRANIVPFLGKINEKFDQQESATKASIIEFSSEEGLGINNLPAVMSKEEEIKSFKNLAGYADQMKELSNEYETLLSKGCAKQGISIHSICAQNAKENNYKKNLSLEDAEYIIENAEEKEGLSAYDNVKKKLSKLDGAYDKLDENIKKSIEKDVEKLKLKLLTAESEYILQRNNIIEKNLRLVLTETKKFKHLKSTTKDLFQDGTIGLMKAADRFDVSRGTKFSTYAFDWIHKNINETHISTSKNIRIPTHLDEALTKFNKTFTQLTNELGREPSREEVAAKMEISAKKLKILTSLPSSISFETPLGDRSIYHEKNQIIDVLTTNKDCFEINVGNYLNEAEEALLDSEQSKNLEKLMSCLTPREMFVIKMRRLAEGELSAIEIGKELDGISDTMVKKIEKNAIRKMQEMATKLKIIL